MTDEIDRAARGAIRDRAWRAGSDDARLDTPTFHRNHDPIAGVLQNHLNADTTGMALEVGSGSGQHIIGFAGKFPGLHWIPSDPDFRHRTSIDAWTHASEASNVAPALDLDMRSGAWTLPDVQSFHAILCINVLHIAPWSVTKGLLECAGELLDHEGAMFVYGPFKKDGQHTAPSNEAFDASLRARNEHWGIRDLTDIEALAKTRNLRLVEAAPMPANNFTLVFRRNP